MASIAIITARGGSKRIPKKNIKEFCGKPIIAYSIEAAIQSNIFDEIMVSTDSKEIVEVAQKYGANIPFLRSEDTSNDFSTTADVVKEVIQEYEKQGRYFDILYCIYPTAPFVSPQKLKMAFNKIRDENADSLMPVVQFSFPPQRAVVIKEGYLQYLFPDNRNKRSQDMEKLYHDCGQFYVCKIDAFKKFNSLITPNTVPLIMPEEEVQDIDNLSDWRLAEIKYKNAILKNDIY